MDADTLSSAYVIISVVRNLYQTDTAKMHDFFCPRLKARLHRRFLSQQLDAIFVTPKLHQVSNMFETRAVSQRQIALKIAPGLHVRF